MADQSGRNYTEEANEAEESKNFFSVANLKVASVNIICGTLNGYSIGFVGVYSTLFDISNTCSSFESKESCETLSNAKCTWTVPAAGDENASAYCGWTGKTQCKAQFTTEAMCTANSDCTWTYSSSTCDNTHGYSALYSGCFAGSMIVGCLIGSLLGGFISTRLGPKRCFLLVGTVGVICSVIYHIATATNLFWLLLAARLVIGFFLGVVCVAAPMYVALNADAKFSKMIGVLFQVFTTLGIFLAATIGLIVGNTINYSGDNQHVSGRMQGICAFSTLFALLVVMLGIFLKGRTELEAGNEVKDEAPMEFENLQQDEYSWGSMLVPLLLGAIVAGTLQLTGINAVMNYAPKMMDSLGMDPLMGNWVVMLVNFVTTICAIPLAKFFSMRQMFLCGSAVTSLSCLFLCGIPVYPGVASTNVKDGVAITGIIIFIAFFEIGVGPCFYVLSQDLFPQSFRPKGASVTMVAQFIFNLIINILYPTATTNISGGPSGDQDKGQAVAFIFFGCIGLVCFVVEYFFLYPWDGGDKEEEPEEGLKE